MVVAVTISNVLHAMRPPLFGLTFLGPSRRRGNLSSVEAPCCSWHKDVCPVVLHESTLLCGAFHTCCALRVSMLPCLGTGEADVDILMEAPSGKAQLSNF